MSSDSRRYRIIPKCDLSTPRLIAVVKEFPVIWDKQRPDYYSDKSHIWKWVASRFWNVSGPEAQHKWETIMSALRQFERRRRQNPQASGDQRRRKVCYKYAKELAFLPKVETNVAEGEGNYKVPRDASPLPASEMGSANQSEDENAMSAMDYSLAAGFTEHIERGIQLTQGVKFIPKYVQSESEAELSEAQSSPLKDMTAQVLNTHTRQRENSAIKARLKKVPQKPLKKLSPIPEEHENLKVHVSNKDEALREPIPSSYDTDAVLEDESTDAVHDQSSHMLKPKSDLPKSLLAKIKRQEEKNKNKEAVRSRLQKQVKAEREKVLRNENKAVESQEVDPTSIALVYNLALAVLGEIKQTKEEDTHTLFCLSLAPRLRAMPKKTCGALTSRISQLFYKVENDNSLASFDDSVPPNPLSSPVTKKRKVVTFDLSLVDTPPKISSSPLSETEWRDTRHKAEGLLTEEMQYEISKTFEASPETNIVSHFGVTLTGRDVHTLRTGCWLNDMVINFYMSLIEERGGTNDLPSVHSFNTFFYPKLTTQKYAGVKNWVKVDIFQVDILLVPIHQRGNHWTLAIIDMRDKSFTHYDSLSPCSSNCHEMLFAYLQEEMKEKRGQEFDPSVWKLVFPMGPKQMNSVDCGVFICAFAELYARGSKINFRQEQMDYYSRKMLHDICFLNILQ